MVNTDIDFEALKENKVILAAITGLVITVAGVGMMSLDSSEDDLDVTPETPESPEDSVDNSSSDTEDMQESSQNSSETTPADSPEDSQEDESRFSSVEKSYEILEIDGVGDEVAVRASTGDNEILEVGGEVVANETVISEFRGVDGELYYVLERNGSKYVFNDGEAVSDGYSMIPYIRDIGGEPTYTVQESLLPSYIVRDGEEIGTDYYEVQWPSWVNGELAYKAIEGTEEFIVHGGEEQARFDEVGYPIQAEGELTFRAVNGNEEFIVHGDERIGSNYSSIDRITQSKGKLTYVVNNDGELELIRDGKKLLEDDWRIRPDTMTWIGGKLAYIVTTGNEEHLIYDGERIGQEYNIQHSNGVIANVNGKIAFTAKQDNQWHIVTEN